MPQIPWSVFCVGMGLLWTMADILNSTLLANTPFSSWYHLQIVSWLEVGPHVHFPFSVLGLCDYTGWLIHASKISHVDSYFFLKSF